MLVQQIAEIGCGPVCSRNRQEHPTRLRLGLNQPRHPKLFRKWARLRSDYGESLTSHYDLISRTTRWGAPWFICRSVVNATGLRLLPVQSRGAERGKGMRATARAKELFHMPGKPAGVGQIQGGSPSQK